MNIDFDISDALMKAVQYGVTPITGFGVYWFTRKDRARQSAKVEITELKKEVARIKEDQQEEFFEIRLAINELSNRIGDTVIYPRGLGSRGNNGI